MENKMNDFDIIASIAMNDREGFRPIAKFNSVLNASQYASMITKGVTHFTIKIEDESNPDFQRVWYNGVCVMK